MLSTAAEICLTHQSPSCPTNTIRYHRPVIFYIHIYSHSLIIALCLTSHLILPLDSLLFFHLSHPLHCTMATSPSSTTQHSTSSLSNSKSDATDNVSSPASSWIEVNSNVTSQSSSSLPSLTDSQSSASATAEENKQHEGDDNDTDSDDAAVVELSLDNHDSQSEGSSEHESDGLEDDNLSIHSSQLGSEFNESQHSSHAANKQLTAKEMFYQSLPYLVASAVGTLLGVAATTFYFKRRYPVLTSNSHHVARSVECLEQLLIQKDSEIQRLASLLSIQMALPPRMIRVIERFRW